MTNTIWSLDPAHSEVLFKIKHLMISNVSGSFQVISAQLEANDDFSNSSVSFTASAASINTNNEQRDTHLRSADFFDVENYASLTFTATGFNAQNEKVAGQLTIKDVTHPVTMDIEFNGVNKDPWGNEKVGFSLSGKINRKDWGLTWNAALETGGFLVADELKILAEAQFVKHV
ncbi:MAG: YceI family protein [Ignavibacteriales bacterium]|nr:YceI family protein [Ignavibacteriales bacterium]